jgi:hypothetical protein
MERVGIYPKQMEILQQQTHDDTTGSMGRCSNGVITCYNQYNNSNCINDDQWWSQVSKCFYLRSMVILIDITYDDWPIQWSAAYSWVIMDDSGSCRSAVQGYPHWGWEEHLESAAWDVGPWELVDNWLIIGWKWLDHEDSASSML